jgi:hypothetical protein
LYRSLLYNINKIRRGFYWAGLLSAALFHLHLKKNLPSKIRDVFYLYYIEGYDTNETAKILGLNGVTVRVRLKRARDMLKKNITKENYNEEGYIYE